MKSEFTIELARPEDAGLLAELCRESYPGSLRWNGTRGYRERWWREVLGSSATETWLGWKAGRAAGLLLLVTNIPAFQSLKSRLRPRRSEMLATACRQPLRVMKKIFGGPGEDPEPAAEEINNMVWLEILAVGKRFQGMGLGSRLVEWAQEQTRRRGCNLGLTVKGGNAPAWHIYKNQGFREKARSGESITMWKELA